MDDKSGSARLQTKPPPEKKKWMMYFAVTLLSNNGAEKAFLGCLIDHANPRTGQCDPSEARIAAETGFPLRTIERAAASLRVEGKYLRRQRRGLRSNAYQVDWAALASVYERYEANRQNWRINPVKSGGSHPVKSGGRNLKGETENRKLKMPSLRDVVLPAPDLNRPDGANLRILDNALKADMSIPDAMRQAWLDYTAGLEGELDWTDNCHGWAMRLNSELAYD